MGTTQIAKYFIIGGFFFIIIGSFIWFLGKIGISFGNLPGDINVESSKGSFYFPVATCIIISIALTIIINIMLWILKK
ncbi:MAG: DUF2905 domain-containing protein [Chlamydiae bacterium]|nr:DUF2905 domain-containing protein [Chlamydiota bacterium]